MSFDPKTLAQDIPDDLKLQDQIDQTRHYVDECKADKENGTVNLVMSCASTMAMQMHMAMSAAITEKDPNDPFKMMWDALDARAQMSAMFMAGAGQSAAIGKITLEDALEQGPFAALDVAKSIQLSTRMAVGDLSDDLVKCIRQAKKHDNDPGPVTLREDGGTMFMRPMRSSKKDTPRDKSKDN